MTHTLIVDDDVVSVARLRDLVAAEGCTVAIAHTLRDARRQIALQQPDLVLLDLALPDGSGMDLFSDPQLVANAEIALITGQASLESSIQALRMGAADYIVKPVNQRQLQGVLARVMRPAQLQSEVDGLNATLAQSGHFGHLWGRAPAMQRVYDQISRVAATGVTVFITGESGSGKEVVAQTVHDLSRRRKQPFLAVNCGAISPQLIESEIFGHEKGSFTGAERMHQGFFERANGGTLFLDEICEMPLDLQVKLLRVLETGRFMRVGSVDSQEADVRVIAATNRPASQAVQAGKLREDLLYRLNVFPVELPPLRERLDDVPLLAEHFLARIGQQEGQRKTFTAEALAQLQSYHWPGNVRELRNAVQRAYVMAAGSRIDECWLPGSGEGSTAADAGTPTMPIAPATAPLELAEALAAAMARPPDAAAVAAPVTAPAAVRTAARGATTTAVKAVTAAGTPAPSAAPADASALASDEPAPAAADTVTLPMGTSMAQAERALILATLKHFRHHKERTAATLGISLKTLYNRLKEYSAQGDALEGALPSGLRGQGGHTACPP